MSRQYVEFHLGQRLIHIDTPASTQTLHQFLRTNPGRMGTKEGCAEGDCGACTILLGELDGDKMSYRAVNSCILFVATLDGKQVLTVEDLSQGDALHPAQTAMVENHGSQCGYCTPGFVMSLAALHDKTDTPNREEIDDAISGNLCRCTGYGPIIEAARRMSDHTMPQSLDHGIDKTSFGKTDGSVAIDSPHGRYFAPRSSAELARLFQENPDATLLAGGTDVGLWVTKGGKVLETIIYIGDVEDLKHVSVQEDTIEVPAAVTLEQARNTLENEFPGLGTLLRRFASKPIRNSGTVCGNIANGSPIGDLPPPLIALGAVVRLRKGERVRDIPLESFFIDYGKQDREPGEFVERLILPRLREGQSLNALKISKRFDQDISAVCAAVFYDENASPLERVRIALGGMAATPKRAPALEAKLANGDWTEDAIRNAVELISHDFKPITDMRASATYRMKSAKNAVLRMLIAASVGTKLETIWDSEVSK